MSTNKLCDVSDTLVVVVGVKLATIGKSAPSDSSVVMDRNLCKAECYEFVQGSEHLHNQCAML